METTLRGRISHAAWFAASLRDDDTPSLSEADLRVLASSIRVVRMPSGSRLLSAGQAVDVLAMVRSGEVEVYWGTGPRRYVLDFLRAGDLLGDAACLSGRRSPVSARAKGDVVLILLPRAALSWILRTQPPLTHRLLLSLADRTSLLQHRLVEVRRRDVRRQLVELILERTGGGNGSFRLAQSTLAQLVFGSRTTVNRILKELERSGAIRVGYRQIEVLDPVILLRYSRNHRSPE
ncbi:MAG TPA: Crp/Fnr family transcriptional regulator [Actinomycetota bacterium]|jgi:CRP-like cAMP-binding protein